MTTKQPATPLPWRTSPARPAEVQQQSGIFTIGLMGMDGAANAAYIVTACNAYPELIAALRQCQQHLEVRPTDTGLDVIRQRNSALLAKLGEDA